MTTSLRASTALQHYWTTDPAELQEVAAFRWRIYTAMHGHPGFDDRIDGFDAPGDVLVVRRGDAAQGGGELVATARVTTVDWGAQSRLPFESGELGLQHVAPDLAIPGTRISEVSRNAVREDLANGALRGVMFPALIARAIERGSTWMISVAQLPYARMLRAELARQGHTVRIRDVIPPDNKYGQRLFFSVMDARACSMGALRHWRRPGSRAVAGGARLSA